MISTSGKRSKTADLGKRITIPLAALILSALFLLPTAAFGYMQYLLDYRSPYGVVNALVTEDFSGNNLGEVAFLTGTQMYVYVVNRNGQLVFTSNQLTGTTALDLAKDDITGDGFYDVIAATDSRVSAYNVKGGSPAPLYSLAPANKFVFTGELRTADFNGDFASEVIIGEYRASLNQSRIRVWRASNGTYIGESGNIPSQIQSIDVGDTNNDGRADVVVATNNGHVSLMQGTTATGALPLLWTWTEPSGYASRAVIVSDVNGDGVRDVAVGTSVTGAGQNNVVYVLSGTNGAVIATLPTSEFPAVLQLQAADIDGDNATELVISTGSYRTSDGTLVDHNNIQILSLQPLTWEYTGPSLGGPPYFKIGDFDLDNQLEIAVSHGTSGSLFFYNGSSVTTEETTSTFTDTLSGPKALDTGHFNYDPADDIARGGTNGEIKVYTYYSPPPPQTYRLFLSDIHATTTTIEPGTRDVLFETYLAHPEIDATITTVSARKMGTLRDDWIVNLRLYRDNGSGAWDASDSLVATSTITSGYATFRIAEPVSSATTQAFFLVGDVATEAAVNKNATFLIQTDADFAAPGLLTCCQFPMYGAQFWTADLTPPNTVLQRSIADPDGQNGWFRSAFTVWLTSSELGLTYYWFDSDEPHVYNGAIVFPSGEHTLYYYSVDLYGNREATQSISFKKDVTPPEMPRGVAASPLSHSSVRLTWRPCLDNPGGSGLASYRIYRNGTQVGLVPGNQTTFDDFGLSASTEYRYTVTAVDMAGNESVVSKEAIVKTPSRPLALPAVRVTATFTSFVISWDSITATEVASLDVERSAPNKASSGWHRINSTPIATSTTFFEDSLPPPLLNKRYYYRLVMRDAGGDVIATTRPVPPGSVQLSKLIGSSGGEISSADGCVSLNVPSDALPTNTLITIETTDSTGPAGYRPLSPTFAFGPDGLSFSNAATVTLSFTPNASTTPDMVAIGTFSNGRWQLLQTTVDTTNGLAAASLNHFSLFGVFFLGSSLDATPPVISAVRSAAPNRLFVTFSEFIDTTSALSLTNYSVSDATITTVAAYSDGKSVILGTTYLEPATEHTLTVTGVRDLAGNTIVDDGIGNVATFTVSSEPHGKYLDNTNKCSLCHKVHLAKSSSLLVKQTAIEVCYTCHDEVGSGSRYAIKAQFESTSAVAFHYPRTTEDVPYCTDCHSPHRDPSLVPRLLSATGPEARETSATSPESFCFHCHGVNSTHPPNTRIVETSYTAGVHFAELPGPSSGTGITCTNCHTTHSSVIRTLMIGGVEEYSCVTCHRQNGVSPESGTPVNAPDVYSSFLNAPDATVGLPGFEPTRTVWYRHPTLDYDNRHTLDEMFDATAAALSQSSETSRHAECEDCHNSHYAQATVYRQAPLAPASIIGASGVQVTYPDATQTTLPAFTFIPYNVGIAYEYELCFKCHSSFAKAWYGEDLASAMSPNNGSYHPVMAPGKNETTAIANSLRGLTPQSQILCSDCHYESDPTLPRGPHGSLYPFILNRNYRFELKETSTTDNYDPEDFRLCYNCHSALPFEDITSLEREDTNFRFHGLHLRLLYDNPAGNTTEGGILTPGAGKGNAICRECHYDQHGTTNPRLVKFSPNVLGPAGEGSEPVFVPRTEPGTGYCLLTCHGFTHTDTNSNY